jgi:hypothetical protein
MKGVTKDMKTGLSAWGKSRGGGTNEWKGKPPTSRDSQEASLCGLTDLK